VISIDEVEVFAKYLNADSEEYCAKNKNKFNDPQRELKWMKESHRS
jgi:hypothetical protein